MSFFDWCIEIYKVETAKEKFWIDLNKNQDIHIFKRFYLIIWKFRKM